MFARTTTAHARPESIDAAVAQVRDETLPAIGAMTGCVGMSMMVDRLSGRCIVSTVWDSEEAMRATVELVRPLRERALEVMRGGRPSVQEWEIAVLERAHPAPAGACVRGTWMEAVPADLGRLGDVYRPVILPAVQRLAGFSSASLLVDRSTGKAVSAVTFDSRQAMVDTREQAAVLRAATSRDVDARVTDVAELELVLADVRAPEPA